MRLAVVLLTCCAAASPALADSDEVATHLGDVLAAEKPCSFSFDQPAIAAYIEKNVSANDADFAHTLDLKTWTRSNSVELMSPSSKMAFCTQQGRVAKAFGLMK